MVSKYQSILFLALFVICTQYKLIAQVEPDSGLYAIGMKQSYSQWCHCRKNNNSPTYAHAYIRPNFENKIQYEEIVDKTQLEELLFFNQKFYNSSTNRRIDSIKNKDGYYLRNISVYAYISYILFDNDMYYTFELSDLQYGEKTITRDASDPCNQWGGSNREGYTTSTTIYLDNPIYIENIGGNRLRTEEDVLQLKVSNYYENGSTEKPVLQVALGNSNSTWEDIEGIIIKPDQTLSLSWSDIVGKKSKSNPKYFDWMGKNLKFRIVKTLINDKQTYGNIVAGIAFYPDGLKFSIEHTTRTSCSNELFVYVNLEDANDKGYMDVDPTGMCYWSLKDEVGFLYNCKMINDGGANRYRIVPQLGTRPDPFDTPKAQTWKLQLITIINTSSFACTRTFTIPAKPDSIKVSQQPGVYTINGEDGYHLPDMSDVYAVLNIDDPWQYADKRKPYIIKKNGVEVTRVSDVPNSYTEMSQQQKDSVDAVFDAEFSELINQEENPYKTYFTDRLRSWFYQNWGGFRFIVSENEAGWVEHSETGDFIIYTVYGASSGIFMIPTNSISANDNIQLTSNSVDACPIITPDGNTLIYSRGGGQGTYKVVLGGTGINNGTKISNSAFEGNRYVGQNGPDYYIVVRGSTISNCDIINLTTNSTTPVYLPGQPDPISHPYLWKDGRIFYRSIDGEIYCAVLNSTNTEIENHFPVLLPPGAKEIVSSDKYAVYINVQVGTFTWQMFSIRFENGQQQTKTLYFNNNMENNVQASPNQDLIYYIDNNDILRRTTTSSSFDEPIHGGVNEFSIPIEDYFYYTIEEQMNSPYVYKNYFDLEEASQDFYPNKGEAATWCEEFKTDYKTKWLNERFSFRLREGVVANTDIGFVLQDDHGCEYPFTVHVKAPPSPTFSHVINTYPSSACAANGRATIQYHSGGYPPYVHTSGTLTPSNTTITVENLQYGENIIQFYDANARKTSSYKIHISSAGLGITNITARDETCTPSNGSIRVDVGGLSGTKTYTVVNLDNHTGYSATSLANYYQFNNLSAGRYSIEVENNSCSYTGEATLNQNIFDISTITTTDATTVDGLGSVTIGFENRTSTVTWQPVVPTGFLSSANANTVTYNNISPNDWTVTARHVDAYSRACDVTRSFTIEAPSFDIDIALEENNDSCTVYLSMTEGNSLITPFRFRVTNSLGTLIGEGTDNNSYSTVIKAEEDYTVHLQYGTNQVELYTFTYPSPTITNQYTITEPLCNGGEGSVTINPTGGIDGTDMLISTDGLAFSTTNTFNVNSGDFTYYVKDVNTGYNYVQDNVVAVNRSKSDKFTVFIPQPDKVSAGMVVPVDVTCRGYNNGSVSIGHVRGGSGVYQYQVDNGIWQDTSVVTTGLSLGEHTIYLRDNLNNCPAENISVINIQEPDTLRVDTFVAIQPACELPNGAIGIEISGGNGFYSYNWTLNGSEFYVADTHTTDTVFYFSDTLSQGLYQLTVLDNKNCELQQVIELEEYFNPEIDSLYSEDARCYGDSNGFIGVISTTGTTQTEKHILSSLDFEYFDTISAGGGTFYNLKKGRYQIITYDTLGCTSDVPLPVVIHQPDTSIFIAVDTVTPVITRGSASGSIFSTMQGGNDGLKATRLYNLQNIAVDSSMERDNFTFSYDKLPAGNYTLQTNDNKGCGFTLEGIQVIEPDSALTIEITHKEDALCKAQTGSFKVKAHGGWGGYGYKLATDNGFNGLNSFNNLCAGSYLVSVQDKYGAIATDTVIIYEPKDSLLASITSLFNPTCENNGNITIDVSGGTPTYQLILSGNTDTVQTNGNVPVVYPNLQAGAYQLVVNDSNGCIFNLDISLADTGLLSFEEINLEYPTGIASSDGAIELKMKGGGRPLTYAWAELFGIQLSETTSTLSGIPSGHYQATVSDQSGCSRSKNIYLPGLNDLALDIVELRDETSYNAQDGYVTLTTTLDSVITLELIDPAGNRGIFSINDSTSQFYAGAGTFYLQNLAGGSYFVSVVSSIGEKAYVEFEIETYQYFSISGIEVIHAGRPGGSTGSIRISISGGSGMNEFIWERLDGGPVTGTIENSENESLIQNIPAGDYIITVIDKFDNIITDTIRIEQPALPLDVNIAQYRNESCKTYEDAYAVLQAEGGWGDYQFKQDTATYYSNADGYNNLTVRQYTFYVIDKLGVTDSVDIEITEPDYLRTTVGFIDSVNCKGATDGNIEFDIQGGTAPYRIAEINYPALWDIDTVARNLPEGYYTYTFTDSNNCIGQDTLLVYMPEPDSLLFKSIDVTHTTCDTNNGSVQVEMQGGSRPYSYTWYNYDLEQIGAESTINNLEQNGYYFLEVLDKNNCPQQYEQLIQPSTNPVITGIETKAILCYGTSTGKAQITGMVAASPYAPFSITWSNADTGNYANGYSPGIHYATITDTNNCSSERYFEVESPDSLWAVLTGFKDAHCFGYNDGFVEVEARGGVGGYSYSWSNGDTTFMADSLQVGPYSLVLTDSNQCSYEFSHFVREPDKQLVDLGDDIKICPGNSIVIDGQDFASHKWSTAQGVISTERYIGLSEVNEYFLEVTDSIGCFAWDTIEITIGNDALEADFIMSSESYLGDTLRIFELSNMELDSMFWEYNGEVFSDVTNGSHPDYMLLLESKDEGIQNISLWAYSGGCISTLIKQVEIVTDRDTTDTYDFVGYEPLISSFVASPNPNDGNFVAKISLREAADIKLIVYSVNYGEVVDNRREYGLKEYELDYQLYGLSTGMYVIMLNAGDERKQVKMIIE